MTQHPNVKIAMGATSRSRFVPEARNAVISFARSRLPIVRNAPRIPAYGTTSITRAGAWSANSLKASAKDAFWSRNIDPNSRSLRRTVRMSATSNENAARKSVENFRST